MSRKAVVFAGVLFAVLVIVGQDVRHASRMEIALARADTLRMRADSAERAAARRAAVLVVRDTVLMVREAALARRDTTLRERTQKVQAEPVPGDCEGAVAERDSLIADWQQQAAGQEAQAADWGKQAADWREQYEEQVRVSALLRAGNASLTRAIELSTRRRTLLSRLLHPELRPAITAGACLAGCSGLGVMAGVSVSF